MMYRYFEKYTPHLTLIQLSKDLRILSLIYCYAEPILCKSNYGTQYTGDHSALALLFVKFYTKTFTLLLKSKILDFETLKK